MILVKWFRFEGNKLMLIPSADGIEYFKNKIPELKTERGGNLYLQEAKEKLAGQDVVAYVAETRDSILHVALDQNVPNNIYRMRVYTAEQLNYYFECPLAIKPLPHNSVQGR